MKRLMKAVNKYGPFIAIVSIILLGIYVRTLDYRWPYLRNIDSYNFYRLMDYIVENKGVLPEYDYLILAPDGASRPVGDPYVYLGAYSYMITRSFIHDLLLWQYLIWFPPFLASLLAIPMYYIGKILYDRKAGIIASAFIVFDSAIINRTLGGDPDSDAIVLLIPLILIALFLYIYKQSENKKTFGGKIITLSLITGTLLTLWRATWGGFWFVPALFITFIFLKILYDFFNTKKFGQAIKRNKIFLLSTFIMFSIFYFLSVLTWGIEILPSITVGPFASFLEFQEIKSESGQFPNVYVSVAELQNPGDIRQIIQRTSAISFSENSLLFLISPFALMIYGLLYLTYSFIKTRKHLETLIFLGMWFLGPFIATILAVRFSILFSAPLAIGSAIFLSKILNIAIKNHKSLGE